MPSGYVGSSPTFRCKSCQENFQSCPSKKQKFCSKKCYAEWQRTHFSPTGFQIGHKPFHVPHAPHKASACLYCGDSFDSLISRNRKFCSNNCRLNYLHSVSEIREKIRRAHLGKKLTAEHKRKLSIKFKGRRIPLLQRIKISRTLMGHAANPGSGRGKSGFRSDIGIYCRSTWEANVIRILLFEEIEFVYEPQQFNFGKFSYTPDFYLPRFDWFLEVKGYINEKTREKLSAFESLGYVFTVIDKTLYDELKGIYREEIENWED